MKQFVLFLAVLTALAGHRPVVAGPINVLFLGYDLEIAETYNEIMSAPDARFDLATSGWNGDVYGGYCPTLADLQRYDAVFVWSNGAPAAGLGDLLADYIDAGGGVVLATFSGYHTYEGLIAGRINTPGYNPFTGGTRDAYHAVTLGSYLADHPLFDGVSALSSSRNNGDWTALDPGATLVASWDNGRPLAGVSGNGKVANLSFFPNTAAEVNIYGDYQQLIRNALVFTANPSAVDIPDNVVAAPEPTSLSLCAIGGVGLILTQFRRSRRGSFALVRSCR
jgi:hypothetical protein